MTPEQEKKGFYFLRFF